MRVAIWLAVWLVLLAGRAPAQTPVDGSPAAAPPEAAEAASNLEPFFAIQSSEWMVTGGPAFGVVILHSARGHRYILQTGSWGRVLTGPHLSGVFRGRFEWAVEAAPLFGQYSPDNVYGLGFSPLVWRWNFEPRGRLAPYAELAGGGLWTTNPVPERTTTANFTAHAGYGVRYFLRPRQAIVFTYRLHHISNGNRLERNPGVNAHVFLVGFSYHRPHQ